MIDRLNPTQPSPAAQADRDRQQLRDAAQAFEAVFLRQLLGSMRQARLAEDPFGSQATEQFREMADARLADTMSEQGSFGIAQLLIQQFERAGIGLGARPAAATSAPGDAPEQPGEERQ